MDRPFLVSERVDGGEQIVAALLTAGIPVTAAFWLKQNEESRWLLHVASSVRDEPDGLRRFLDALPEDVRVGTGGPVDADEVRLVSPRERSVQAVLALYGQAPGRFPMRYRGLSLGDLGVEAAYLYTPLVPNPVAA